MSRGLLQDEYYDCNIGVAWVIHHIEPQSVFGVWETQKRPDHCSAPIRLNKYPCRSPDTPRAPRDSPLANRTSGHIYRDIAWTSFSPRWLCWGCCCRQQLGAVLWLAFCQDYWLGFYLGFCWLRMMDWGGNPGPRWRGTGCWSALCSPETSETCDEEPGGQRGWWWTSGGLSSSTCHWCQCCPQTTGWTFFCWLPANLKKENSKSKSILFLYKSVGNGNLKLNGVGFIFVISTMAFHSSNSFSNNMIFKFKTINNLAAKLIASLPCLITAHWLYEFFGHIIVVASFVHCLHFLFPLTQIIFWYLEIIQCTAPDPPWDSPVFILIQLRKKL